MSKSLENRKQFSREWFGSEAEELHEFLDAKNIPDQAEDENNKLYLMPLIDRVIAYGKSKEKS